MAGKTNHREKALNHKLHIRLWQASDAIRASRQKALKKMGVTVEQAGVLHIIQRLVTGLPPTSLPRRCSASPRP